MTTTSHREAPPCTHVRVHSQGRLPLVTELAFETAPRWPPDCPAIQGPPRIDLERADAPPARARWCLGHTSGIWSGKRRNRATQRLRSRRATEFLYPTRRPAVHARVRERHR